MISSRKKGGRKAEACASSLWHKVVTRRTFPRWRQGAARPFQRGKLPLCARRSLFTRRRGILWMTFPPRGISVDVGRGRRTSESLRVPRADEIGLDRVRHQYRENQMAEKPDVLAWAVQVGIRYAADRPWYFCNAGQFGKRARCTTRCPMHPSDHPRFRVRRYPCNDGQGWLWLGQCPTCEAVCWSYADRT